MSMILTRSDAFHRVSGARGPSLLVRLLKRLGDEIRVRRDLRALASLSDAALHDIGMARGGMEEAVRHGRGGGAALPSKPLSGAAASPAAAPSAATEWR